MIISVILFSYFTSTIMEMTLNDTINQTKNQQNIDKINGLIDKYNFSGTTKNYLTLLESSFTSMKLQDEIEFI